MGPSDNLTLFFGKYNILFVTGLVFISLFILWIFHQRRFKAFELGVISIMTAISVVGRLVFFFIPFFKPSTAMIIITGSVFGPGVGVSVGVMTGLLSNIMFGQGTWTPFQMFFWGLIGFFAGFLKDSKFVAIIYGFLMTVCVYGVGMNFYTMLFSGNPYTWNIFYLFELHGLPGDVIHGIATTIFLFICWYPFRKKLCRMRNKYGVLTKEGMKGT